MIKGAATEQDNATVELRGRARRWQSTGIGSVPLYIVHVRAAGNRRRIDSSIRRATATMAEAPCTT